VQNLEMQSYDRLGAETGGHNVGRPLAWVADSCVIGDEAGSPTDGLKLGGVWHGTCGLNKIILQSSF
jgi:hypothetical protein